MLTSAFSLPFEDPTCYLCYKAFSGEHLPGPLDNCSHLFGKQCLYDWIAANDYRVKNCPSCGAVMFGEEDAAQQAEQPLPSQAPPSVRGTPRNPNRLSVRVIVKETPSLYQRFIDDHANIASFQHTLWHRVLVDLVPAYNDSHRLITPELELEAQLVVLHLLNDTEFEVGHDEWDNRLLIDRALNGDNEADLLIPKLIQLVIVMVMLTPLIPIDLDTATGCLKLLPDVHSPLDFNIVNAAVEDPSTRNAPILHVITKLLINDSVEHVTTEIGAQWHRTASPSDWFFAVASRVKGILDLESYAVKERCRHLKVPVDKIVRLWQLTGDEEDIASRGIFTRLRDMFSTNKHRRGLGRSNRETIFTVFGIKGHRD
jgi:hypothetical protein